MRAKDFIVEYSQFKTAQAYGPKMLAVAKRDKSVVAHDPNSQEEISLDWLIQGIEESDPTPHKEYTEWLCRIYAAGQTKYEDIESKAGPYLKRFNELKIKKRLQGTDRDIGSFKSLGQLADAIERYPEVQEEIVDKGQAKVYYEDATMRIIVPLDIQAAKYYGQGTRWCTAAEKNNMFDRYNKEGQMYIILPKKPTYGGEKYQFHFESSQFMDPKDEAVNLDELKTRFPQLTQIFAAQALENMCFLLMASSKEIINNWHQITQHVSSSFKFPFKKIIHGVREEALAEYDDSPEEIENILAAFEDDLLRNAAVLTDVIMQSILIAGTNPGYDLNDTIEHSLENWLFDSDTGAAISQADIESDGKFDTTGARFAIIGEIHTQLEPIIRKAAGQYLNQNF